MSTILFISTLVLNLACIAFSGVYVWLNAFSKITDLADRNKSILRITSVSMAVTMLFAFLSCLLSKSGEIEAAIQRTTTLYGLIAVSWLIVLVLCGAAMIFSLVSKKEFRKDLVTSVKSIFIIALCGAVAAMVFSWLFS